LRKKPRNYVGQNHETIGSDILSVLAVIPLPGQILGPELMAAVKEVKPDGWYPISLLLDLLDRIDERVGRFGLLQMGRKLFQGSHAEQFKKVASTAADAVYGIDGMYHRANRGGGIGGWEVALFRPGRAELIKTTPHHCVMEEGILSEAMVTLGIPATVQQTVCLREGADHCRYAVASIISEEKWMGGRPPVP
jgi:hypothetical protein